MKTACPSCGADVEFRYDDSFVRVCSYCRTAVARSDRGVDSLGKVADLMPMESPLRLFATGQLGTQSFILVGMAQLRHQAGGMTQEWYAKFSGSWGWLAEAQGRYYMTFEVEGVQLPPIEALTPGTRIELPNMIGTPTTFTVGEVGGATYVAANGELPFRLVPAGGYRFVDLSDGAGYFATIDYGVPGDAPTLYTGQQVTLADLQIRGGEVGPPRDATITSTITSTRLACPNCNAPIELHTPDILRAACAYCSHLLDVQAGTLRVLGQVRKATPRIPLGTRATFCEGEMTIIGYVERSAQVECTWYPFEEYLLYAPAIGFRWLVSSDGHWSYVQPVAIGAVTFDGGGDARYDGVRFRKFQGAQLRVDTVVGELYWQVSAGEQVWGNDFVAPPAMLSHETARNEENWSLSTYVKPGELAAALGDKPELQLGGGTGVAPNQPDPAGAAAVPLTLAFLALIVLGIVFAAIASARERYTHVVSIPSGTVVPPPAAEPVSDANPPNVFFSEPFTLEAGKNVELGFRASLANSWAYVAASLVNVATGDVVSVDASMEHYTGVEDGEAWSEGKDYDTEVIGPVAPGDYVLRLEMQHGGTSGEVPLTVRVRQGVFRVVYLGWALVILGIPFLILGIYSYSFERRRWSNSTEGTSAMPKTPLTLLVGAVVLLLTGIVVILKAIAESSSDD